jgi:hypothetical protein
MTKMIKEYCAKLRDVSEERVEIVMKSKREWREKRT